MYISAADKDNNTVRIMDFIKIGIGVSSIGRFLPFVGKAAGLFEREEIVVDIVNQRDEEKVVSDIVSGETPIGTPNTPSLLFSLLEGNDLVILGGILNRPGFYLTARKIFRSLGDLRGKTIGINQPRRMAGVVMLALLRKWGWEQGRDVTLVDLGVNDRSLEALKQEKLDAALLPPEKAFAAEEIGFNLVANSLNLHCNWVPLATTRRFLQSNPILVEKVARVYLKSIQVFKNDSEKSLQVVGRNLPELLKKPVVLEKAHRLFSEQFEDRLTPSLDSISAMLEEVAHQDPRARNILATSLVETII